MFASLLRRSVLLLAGVTLAVGLLSCGSDTAGPGTSGKLKLAFVTNNSANFWTIARAGVNQALKEVPNVEAEFKFGDNTAAKQKAIMEDLLARGINGIAISPNDPENQSKFLDEVAGKAFLMTQDSDAPGSKRMVYLGTNNRDAGKQAGEYLKKALPEGGKIMVFVGSMGPQNARDRLDGIKDVIAGTKIEIIDTRTDDTDKVKAKNNVADAIVKYPDIAGLVGLWNYNGPAILNAVKDANKNGKIKIVCFDEEEETLAGVKSGDIFCTVVQQPFEFGRQSIEVMAKAIRGDKSVIPASKQIFIPTQAITKENVDEFSAKLKERLASAGK